MIRYGENLYGIHAPYKWGVESLKTNELRQAYLKFFESKDHRILPSASLIPSGDPTLLLTAAGMVPFKPYFLGTAKPEHHRVTTCQKCVRTGDIDNVGRTTRHGTFFEMLGNFSFGDYFKKEAIAWAWEFVTEHLGFRKDQLWITIYLDDDEAYKIWNENIGISADRIVRKGKADNFWEIGVGPCGPCSEIHVDRGADVGCGSPDCNIDCNCGRFIEIWNLVFIQFHKDENGTYTPLERKGIDTGMGLERIAALLQNVPTIFDADETRCIRDRAAQLAGVTYGDGGRIDVAIRVITDHSRAATFMVNDGILPTNEGRGYVLRRLLRRAARFGKLIGIEGVFMPKMADAVIDTMLAAYPDLVANRERILKTIQLEEERFLAALEQGSQVLDAVIERTIAEGGTCVAGSEVFRLYDTFGFPYELTSEIAEERGLTVDKQGFDQAMQAQRERARSARGENSYLDEKSERYHEALGDVSSEFVGYESIRSESRIIGLIGEDGRSASRLCAGERGEIVLDSTPFYAASGGQVADVGEIRSASGGIAGVTKVSRPLGDAVVHEVNIEKGEFKMGDEVVAAVDFATRRATAGNHTATHLLHAALRKVLGSHVQQAGSYVDSERLRFDFSHHAAVTPEELMRVEQIVNEWVLLNTQVKVTHTTIDEAHRQGAMALFDEKYGDTVRMVSVGDVSLELCGGTHVAATGEIGLVKIVGEGGIAAGVRRIEAVTGLGALRYVNDCRSLIRQLADSLKASEEELPARVEKLQSDLHASEKENGRLRAKIAAGSIDSILESAVSIGGISAVAAQVDAADAEGLRNMADMIRDKMGSGIVILAAATGDKAAFVTTVTRDLIDKGFNAGNIVRDTAKAAGGGGGGRPDMAQAGGKDCSLIPNALDAGIQAVVAHHSKIKG